MDCWKSERHFCSWLKVCPDNRISGGKVLSSRSRKTKNRAAGMFRLAAQGAMQSKTAVGAFIRRLRARLGAPTAINAGANKLARLFYRMLKFGAPYVEQGQTYYEQRYKDPLTLQPHQTSKRTRISAHAFPAGHGFSFLGDLQKETSWQNGLDKSCTERADQPLIPGISRLRADHANFFSRSLS